MTTLSMSVSKERPGKIQRRHLERLAVVYIRQSTMQQLHRHQESTRQQYGLVDVARQYGWSVDRTLTLDEDLGTSGASADGRPGFQRLLTEVALDHVGLVLGLEISRLARSNKDWHQLLELCARFGTLIADLDGLYDPSQYNDRLLLGLKGTMSEAELHILRQRLLEGKLAKARRGELNKPVPTGYLRLLTGEVTLDPDEEVRSIVRLIFDKFDEVGTASGVLQELVKEKIHLGIRLRTGQEKGKLVWRRPHRGMIVDILRNPIYAGAYVYGRRRTDPRRKKPGKPATGITPLLPPEEWHVCLQDKYPSYITWERYERNQERLSSNRAKAEAKGAIRSGAALLQGLVVCGRCGHRMSVQYSVRKGIAHPRYACNHDYSHYRLPICQSFSARCLDDAVSELVLLALKPAALEISIKLHEEIETERKRLVSQWDKRIQRARYDAERAGRQYNAVEPENRLVASTLEREWEQKILEEQRLLEDFNRFQGEYQRTLTKEDVETIKRLSKDLPALWGLATTTNSERKEVIRLLINKVCVDVICNSEYLNVRIEWSGGEKTEIRVRRPVAKLTQLSNYDELIEKLRGLHQQGFTADQIAEKLNADGWVTPTKQTNFNPRLVRVMLHRHGVTDLPRGRAAPPGNNPNEWWLKDLADELEMSLPTLYGWMRRGWVKARRLKKRRAEGVWVVVADQAELDRLRALRKKDSVQGKRQAVKASNT